MYYVTIEKRIVRLAPNFVASMSFKVQLCYLLHLILMSFCVQLPFAHSFSERYVVP
jgi:hypothetical protein